MSSQNTKYDIETRRSTERESARGDVIVRSDGPHSAEIDGEAVLLEPEAGTYYGMNELGTRVWERIETPTTVAEMEASIHDEYDVDREVVRADLRSFLSDLAAADLIEVRESPDDA